MNRLGARSTAGPGRGSRVPAVARDGETGRDASFAYFASPPTYSEAICRDSSWNLTVAHSLASCLNLDALQAMLEALKAACNCNLPFQSTGGSKTGGCSTLRSIKLSRTPRSHFRLLFWQFRHVGKASSHLRCRLRHVKHPVRTRLGLATVGDADGGTGSLLSLSLRLTAFSRPADTSVALEKVGGVCPSITCEFLGLAVAEWLAA